MSKLEELIAELCPDGVEYRELGEVSICKKGTSITQSQVVAGDIPIIAGGQKPAYYHNIANRTEETIAISSSGAYAGYVSYWTIPVFLSDSFSLHPDQSLNTKYTYYYLQNIQKQIYQLKKGAGIPHVYGKDISRFKIPLPPLAVQEEIVRILDTFTETVAELQAELQARKKQYEYYREQLLTFKDGEVEYRELNEVCDSIFAGGDLPKKYNKGQLTPSKDFPYPIYSNGTEKNSLYGYTNTYKVEREAVTISARGTIGYHTIRNGMFTPIVRLITLIPNLDYILTKYLNYILYTIPILPSGVKTGTGIPQLIVPNIKKIRIPLPSLAEQERIVQILDSFDALVNDISQGIPAEIEARQKQYEYYRNKLLTFKEKA